MPMGNTVMMRPTLATLDLESLPTELAPFLRGAKIFDRSCSPAAKVYYIQKDKGYFLKSAAEGAIGREAAMTRYFHRKGLAPPVIAYISAEADWLLTKRLPGEDCRHERYLAQPQRLTDTLAAALADLHAMDAGDCPQNHTRVYLEKALLNYETGNYDRSHFPDSFGYSSAEDAIKIVEENGHWLKADTLLHGDYCLPNILLQDWRLAGFVDLDNAGVGDRHVDLFWAAWSLGFNLGTDRYRERFYDAYGRNQVDTEMLKVIAAIEVFG